ncbi:MAG: hypothetical protein F6K19_14545 [Cyanothece sp. SIO1E1]|nr:hypothetical protein [Cyanothece sp. SIO1E1]
MDQDAVYDAGELSMEWWQSLVGTALMGTDRQTPTPPPANDALTAVAGQLDWSQPESALLGAAGAIALYQQVGQQPMQKELPAVEPCPLDDRPCCSVYTARHVDVALQDYPEVMPELLMLLAVAGQRVPAQLLPKLLHLGQQHAKLRPQIVAVLGQRGYWLAAQNPAWSYGQGLALNDFSPTSPEFQAIWQQGSRSQRAMLLQQWRQLQPDAARAALEAVWASELAKDRETLMAGLATHLSLADEPFLAQALGDRAQGVRKLAVELLLQLPESGLCQRMAQRAQSWVQLQDQGTTLKIEVTLPENCEKDWERDGINPKPPKGEGKRAWWLWQILASTPLSVWQAEPTVIAQAMTTHEWRDLLLRGWGLAAQRQHNAVWADALLSQFDRPQFDQVPFAELLALLTAERREQLLRAKLPPKQAQDEALTNWLQQVAQSLQPWSLVFSQLILEQLLRLLRTSKNHNYTLSYAVKNMALTLHPELAPAMVAAIANLPEEKYIAYWQNTLDEVLRQLSFRQEMHQAFANRD